MGSSQAYDHTVTTILNGVQAIRYSSLVSFSILYYDYILTLPMELERFWKPRRLSVVSVLFLMNRYLSLLGQIPVILEYFGNFPEISYHQYFAAVTQGVVAALLIVRTYALYQRAKWVLVLLVSICLVGGTVSIWTIATGLKSTATKRVPMPTCDVSISVQEGHHLAIAWGAMLFFDVAVFLLTFMKAIWVGRVWKGTLFQVMIRDGTLYFGILVVLNVTNILTYVLAFPPAKGMATTITNVMASTLTSRLMLNLRDPNLQGSPHWTRPSQVQSAYELRTLSLGFKHSRQSDRERGPPDTESDECDSIFD